MSEKDLPNKCDFCGLKQTYPPDTKNLFRSLRLLFDEGIIPQEFRRNLKVVIGGGDDIDIEEFCLISHPSWSSKEKKCESWQLDVGLEKGDVLSINLASEMQNVTRKIYLFTVIIFWFTFLQIAIMLKPVLLKYISLLI